MQAPDFWEDPRKSAPLLRKRRGFERRRDTLVRLRRAGNDLAGWRELLAEGEADEDAVSFVEGLEAELGELESKLMFSGPDDALDALVAIHPGAGGTESQDWAEVLERMYLRYCEARGFEIDMIERQDGGEAGIRSVTFAARGEYALGYLKSERGVHRLVRISPFDAARRRQTSFASVDVYPEIDDTVEIEILGKDLRIDTYSASGPGGQYVNRTESAVRMTHLPTGIVVSCQNERSQVKNRAMAMKVLRSRLYDLEMKRRAEEQAERQDAKKEIGFGSQIRSYVLHPYRMVKDHRLQVEIGDADSVLDGGLGPLVDAFLRQGMEAGD